jgi:hypothetical protein
MFRSIALSLTSIVLIAGGSMVAHSAAPSTSSAPTATRPPAGSGYSSSADDRGATYYALERSAIRVTTKFADSTTAVSERNGKGRIRTRLFDVGGNQQAAVESAAGTLDGANARLKFGNVDRMETEYESGFVAVTTHALSNGEPVQFTRLFQSGVDVGRIGWYPRSKKLLWRFPGLTTGMITEQVLDHEPGGKWPFQPDMAWGNVQAIAFFRMHTAMKEQAALARQGSLTRLANFFVPTVNANEPGCDNLHWLDTSIVRPCCDIHDRCYAKNGCTAQTWWQFWSSWKCDFCNMSVIWCFNTLTVINPCDYEKLYC